MLVERNMGLKIHITGVGSPPPIEGEVDLILSGVRTDSEVVGMAAYKDLGS